MPCGLTDVKTTCHSKGAASSAAPATSRFTQGFGEKAIGSEAPGGGSKVSAATQTSCERRSRVPSTQSGGDITTARSSSPARIIARKSRCMLTLTSMGVVRFGEGWKRRVISSRVSRICCA